MRATKSLLIAPPAAKLTFNSVVHRRAIYRARLNSVRVPYVQGRDSHRCIHHRGPQPPLPADPPESLKNRISYPSATPTTHFPTTSRVAAIHNNLYDSRLLGWNTWPTEPSSPRPGPIGALSAPALLANAMPAEDYPLARTSQKPNGLLVHHSRTDHELCNSRQ